MLLSNLTPHSEVKVEDSNVYQMFSELGAFISPSRRCFDDAMATLSRLIVSESVLIKDLRLGHGVCLDPYTGKHFSHAWVENGNLVWQDGYLGAKKCSWSVRTSDFYENYLMLHHTLYSTKEVGEKGVTHGSNGPWVKEYSRYLLNRPETILGLLKYKIEKVIVLGSTA